MAIPPAKMVPYQQGGFIMLMNFSFCNDFTEMPSQ